MFGSNAVLNKVASISPHFAAVLAAYPDLAGELAEMDDASSEPDSQVNFDRVGPKTRAISVRGSRALRKAWAKLLLSIAFRDILERISMAEAKRLQTLLWRGQHCRGHRDNRRQNSPRVSISTKSLLHLGVLALGKLGGRALDYNSDLDLLLVYDDAIPCPLGRAFTREFYAPGSSVVCRYALVDDPRRTSLSHRPQAQAVRAQKG
jgi:glutamine synthetase adenylyltransferase